MLLIGIGGFDNGLGDYFEIAFDDFDRGWRGSLCRDVDEIEPYRKQVENALLELNARVGQTNPRG